MGNDIQTNKEIDTAKKRNIILIIVSLIVSLIGAIVYKIFPATFSNFVSIGLVSASINMLLAFYFGFKNYFSLKHLVKSEDDLLFGKWVLIGGGFTLVIPYFIFFTVFSILLSGFNIPFR